MDTKILREIKPRNARSKRALDKKAPKIIENAKRCLFLRGTKCSQVVQDALTDLYQLKVPLAKKFTKKNDIHPFDDPSSIEFFSEKNDAPIVIFGSSSKKRPHTITMVRLFGFKILDMLEMYLDPESFRNLAEFKNKKCAVGLKPMLLFAGTAFENPVANEFSLLKNLFIDFFKGELADKIDVEGLQYLVSISAIDVVDGKESTPIVHLRAYCIRTKRSGQKLPRVEVQEMGPRMDFRIGRFQQANESVLKEALKKPRTTEERPKKNISTDIIGDKIGRIHLGRQDIKVLQTRKMKGLKRTRDINIDSDTKSNNVINNEKKLKLDST
ncbi:Ribosome production factor 2 [Erysiphe necator]|nr:Ribosome production factor 2 [Erysiphe necator]